jgi:rsbT co-antagonist protein RsbR
MMSPATTFLARFINDQRGALMASWQRNLGGADDQMDDSLPHEMDSFLLALVDHLKRANEPEAPSLHELTRVLRDIAEMHATRGLAPEDAMRFVQSAKDTIVALMQTQTPPTESVAPLLALSKAVDHCIVVLTKHFISAREAIIHRQAHSLLDMSTPVITLWDAILLLPLVGIVDSVRAVQVAERLLEAIGQTEAEVTLIDVTGVPVMDTSVVRHLLRAVAAAEMLGTKVILTGISPTTAQTIVKLGLDLSRVPTRGTLKSGVALALSLTHRKLVPVQATSAAAE